MADVFRALLPLVELYLARHPEDFNEEMLRRLQEARRAGRREVAATMDRSPFL